MSSIAALTSLTLRQVLGRRGLVFAAVFACLLVLVGNSVTLDSAARLGVLIQVVSSLTFTVVIVATVFTTAGLVPADIRDKTVYITLTKPVSRAGYLLGRLVGAAAVAVAFAVAFSLIAVAYTGVRLAMADESTTSGFAALRVGRSRSISFNLVPENTPVRISKKNGRYHLDGELGLEAHIAFARDESFWVRTDDSGRRYLTLRITSRIEGAETRYPVHIEFAGNTTTAQLASRKPTLVRLPMGDDPLPQRVVLTLRPGLPTMAMNLDPDDIQLLKGQSSVAVNLGKGVLSLAAAAVVVAAVAVMLSTVSGFAVASLTTLAVVLVGMFSQGLSSLMQVYGGGGPPTYNSLFDTVIAHIGWALVPLIEGLRLLVPELARYNLASFYDQSLAVPGALVGSLLLRAGVASMAAAAAGAFFFSRREPAAGA